MGTLSLQELESEVTDLPQLHNNLGVNCRLSTRQKTQKSRGFMLYLRICPRFCTWEFVIVFTVTSISLLRSNHFMARGHIDICQVDRYLFKVWNIKSKSQSKQILRSGEPPTSKSTPSTDNGLKKQQTLLASSRTNLLLYVILSFFYVLGIFYPSVVIVGGATRR